MQRERALFLSRTAAYINAKAVAIRNGISEETANLKCRVYPKYKRGEMVGWEAWYPNRYGMNPVIEEEFGR